MVTQEWERGHPGTRQLIVLEKDETEMNNLKLGSNNCFNEKRGELDFEGSE